MNAPILRKLALAAVFSACALLPWPGQRFETAKAEGAGTAAPAKAVVMVPDQSAGKGSKKLMADWNARKTAARDKALEILRRSGALPKNGSVVFTASVKPAEGKPGSFDVVIESLSVAPAPASPGAGAAGTPQGLDAALAPRDISGIVETRVLSASDSGRITDTLVIKAGQVAP